jgi:hypothetical protein
MDPSDSVAPISRWNHGHKSFHQQSKVVSSLHVILDTKIEVALHLSILEESESEEVSAAFSPGGLVALTTITSDT